METTKSQFSAKANNLVAAAREWQNGSTAEIDKEIKMSLTPKQAKVFWSLIGRESSEGKLLVAANTALSSEAY